MDFRWLRTFALLATGALVVTACAATPAIARTEAAIASEQAATSATTPEPSGLLSRDESVQLLMNDAFLPASTARCVIDAIFLDAGIYDPTVPEGQAAMEQGDLVATCSDQIGGQDRADDDVYVPQIDQGTPRTQPAASDEPAVPTAPFELTEASMPALNPGALATGSVELGGKTIDYVTVTPAGFEIGDTAPVFFAFPPGAQDLTITRNVVDAVYQDQAVARGWVVVSPASPGGTWYSSGNPAVIPEFISWMQAWVDIENGKPHIGGMSNGGLSAFHIAGQMPTQFQSLLAFPGYPRQGADRNALSGLADLPVRMWVGGDDTSWVLNMETTRSTLVNAGGDVELWILPGEPHVLQSTQDGAAFFDQLDDARLG